MWQVFKKANLNEFTNGCMYGWMHAWMHRCMDGQMGRWMGRWMSKWLTHRSPEDTLGRYMQMIFPNITGPSVFLR